MIIERHKMKMEESSKHSAAIIFDLVTLTHFCKYLLTRNTKIRKRHLLNMKSVIDIIDTSLYRNDPDKIKRLRFLESALDTRINRKIDDPQIILVEAARQMGDDLDFIDLNDFELDNYQMEWVSEVITETLDYSFIYDSMDKMQDICTRFKATDYRNRGSIVNEFKELNKEIGNNFRKAKVDSLNDMTFSLVDGIFEDAISDTYNIITNPNRRLVTGMQGLNSIIGGGFENSRVYMFLGLAAVGKSMLLLNLLAQLKKYNANYVPKDPTKIPCIVLLTMENSVVETINRLFSIVTNGQRLADCESAEEAIYKLRTEGGLTISDSSPIDIVVKYKPNRSIDTNYLYALCEDLEDEGREVICLMQDHVKRIRSIDRISELRLELGAIVNEFKSFANEKDIPVISIGHLNREADKILENIKNSNKSIDSTKLLGKSVIGESFLMLDNLDFGANINIDYDEQENKYMCFNVCKQRDNAERNYVVIPFATNSKIALCEDLYSPVPMYLESLHEPTLQRFFSGGKQTFTGYHNMYLIDGEDEPEEEEKNNGPTIPKFTSNVVLEQSKDDDDDDEGTMMVFSNSYIGKVAIPKEETYYDYADMDIKAKKDAIIQAETEKKELKQAVYFMPQLPKVTPPLRKAVYFFD